VRRRFLGRTHTLTERVRTYWTDEALEVDLADHYEIRRRRVFFDEILLVTLHSRRGVLASLIPLLLAILFALVALGVSDSGSEVSLPFWALAALFFAVAVVAAAVPVWVVTVYGKRTRARMHFRMRQGKARSVYAEICRAANDAQRAVASRLVAETPEAPPLPLSDSEVPLPPTWG